MVQKNALMFVTNVNILYQLKMMKSQKSLPYQKGFSLIKYHKCRTEADRVQSFISNDDIFM